LVDDFTGLGVDSLCGRFCEDLLYKKKVKLTDNISELKIDEQRTEFKNRMKGLKAPILTRIFISPFRVTLSGTGRQVLSIL
jgi:hypothetical protein